MMNEPLEFENLHIILFDGVCNLCNKSVDFIIRRDKKGYFKFASLQSEIGQELLKRYGLSTQNFDSFVLVSKGEIFQKSTAALRVAKELGGIWKILYGFIFIPAFIRNFFYDLIARNRYTLFGQKDTCRLPTAEERSRFLS